MSDCDPSVGASNGTGRDRDEAELDNVFINATDGLPAALTLREGGVCMDSDDTMTDGTNGTNDFQESLITDEDLPSALIVTGLDQGFFDNADEKKSFEEMFQAFDAKATFFYFKSFKRARVNYSTSAAAAKARIQLHEVYLGKRLINCYFAQPVTPKDPEDDGHLRLPAPHKQFLISPPASPPVDWAPAPESQPCINYDLVAAIANLTPGETHELHEATGEHPGITLLVAEEEREGAMPKPKIMQTSCPQRNS